MIKKKKDIWRDDKQCTDIQTANSIVVRSKDMMRTEGAYSMYVWHVEGPDGKGFMPVIYFEDNPCNTSKVFYGIDDIAYIYAVTKARSLFKRELDRAKMKLESEGEHD